MMIATKPYPSRYLKVDELPPACNNALKKIGVLLFTSQSAYIVLQNKRGIELDLPSQVYSDLFRIDDL